MSFPVLLWDDDVDELACTACMACVNYCPTQCIAATLAGNPGGQVGQRRRRTVARTFEIDYSRCIECGICVDKCDYEAIALGSATGTPSATTLSMEELVANGRRYVAEVGRERALRKPDVRGLLEKARHRIPPASESDGARRAWSRLRTSLPLELDTSARNRKE